MLEADAVVGRRAGGWMAKKGSVVVEDRGKDCASLDDGGGAGKNGKQARTVVVGGD